MEKGELLLIRADRIKCSCQREIKASRRVQPGMLQVKAVVVWKYCIKRNL